MVVECVCVCVYKIDDLNSNSSIGHMQIDKLNSIFRYAFVMGFISIYTEKLFAHGVIFQERFPYFMHRIDDYSRLFVRKIFSYSIFSFSLSVL